MNEGQRRLLSHLLFGQTEDHQTLQSGRSISLDWNRFIYELCCSAEGMLSTKLIKKFQLLFLFNSTEFWFIKFDCFCSFFAIQKKNGKRWYKHKQFEQKFELS